MSQPFYHDNHHQQQHRRTTTNAPVMSKDNYEHELMKIMQRERRFSHVEIECIVFLCVCRVFLSRSSNKEEIFNRIRMFRRTMRSTRMEDQRKYLHLEIINA